MNIGVDARELTGKPTGVGTYLAHLLDEWARMPDAQAHRWTLYAPGTGDEQGSPVRLRPPFHWRRVAGATGTWWEQGPLAAAVRRDRQDLLFAPGYTAPLAVRVPVVLTVHDVSFIAHPEWFRGRERFRRRTLTRWSAQTARTVLTVSDFSKREIVSRLGVPESRVEVVRHGISRPAATPPTHCRPPVVLFVGSIFNRRHVPDLVRAFASLAGEIGGANLEIVGDNRTHPPEDLNALAASLGVSDRVNVRSYVPDEELERLYGSARVFAFLSEYEGFGFTPLEALAHSVPVVVLDTPVAREVYEGAAVFARLGDITGIAEALRRLLLDAGARAAQIERAQPVLARYCWRDAACRTLAALERAAAGAPR